MSLNSVIPDKYVLTGSRLKMVDLYTLFLLGVNETEWS